MKKINLTLITLGLVLPLMTTTVSANDCSPCEGRQLHSSQLEHRHHEGNFNHHKPDHKKAEQHFASQHKDAHHGEFRPVPHHAQPRDFAQHNKPASPKGFDVEINTPNFSLEVRK